MREIYDKIVKFLGMDKIAHFFGSAFLTLAFCRLFPIAFAAMLAATVGVMKEVLDKNFDWMDLLADGLGIILSIIIMIL